MWGNISNGRFLNRGCHAYHGRNLYGPNYNIAGIGRGQGGLGRGPCAYLIGSDLLKEGTISKEEEQKILLNNIDLLKKEIQQLEERVTKISEDVK